LAVFGFSLSSHNRLFSHAMAVQDQRFDYAIVGGGCNGASTALAVQKEWPGARIIWFEGTDTATASKDINKIIRTRYVDDDYIAFAEKAMKLWKTTDPYRKFYHRSSWVQVIKEGSYRSKMRGPNDTKITVENLLRITGSREGPKLDSEEELWLNESVGYADSDFAVEAVAKEAASRGVLRLKKDIVKLIVTDGNVCEGVELEDGLNILAEKTIMATGAWTVRLLEKSAVWFPHGFFTIAAVPVTTLTLSVSEFAELESMPILVTEIGTSP
jgi:glycine/D-amino acid oxidase-like deaminating enzyme